MVVSGAWSEEDRIAWEAERPEALELNIAKGWKQHPIEFLADLSELRRLRIIAIGARLDATPISELAGLEDLEMAIDVGGHIEYEHLKRLARLCIADGKAHEQLLCAKSLRELHVGNLRKEDCAFLEPMHELAYLEIIGTTLETLLGLEHLPRLKTVRIARAPKLTDFSALSRCPSVTQVDIANCPHMGNIEFVRGMAGLERLTLTDTGTVDTLEPAMGLPKLAVLGFVGRTVIADGRVAMIKNLPSFRRTVFQNRRHYDATREELGYPSGVAT